MKTGMGGAVEGEMWGSVLISLPVGQLLITTLPRPHFPPSPPENPLNPHAHIYTHIQDADSSALEQPHRGRVTRGCGGGGGGRGEARSPSLFRGGEGEGVCLLKPSSLNCHTATGLSACRGFLMDVCVKRPSRGEREGERGRAVALIKCWSRHACEPARRLISA